MLLAHDPTLLLLLLTTHQALLYRHGLTPTTVMLLLPLQGAASGGNNCSSCAEPLSVWWRRAGLPLLLPVRGLHVPVPPHERDQGTPGVQHNCTWRCSSCSNQGAMIYTCDCLRGIGGVRVSWSSAAWRSAWCSGVMRGSKVDEAAGWMNHACRCNDRVSLGC
jgi:hypothetical protein